MKIRKVDQRSIELLLSSLDVKAKELQKRARELRSASGVLQIKSKQLFARTEKLRLLMPSAPANLDGIALVTDEAAT